MNYYSMIHAFHSCTSCCRNSFKEYIGKVWGSISTNYWQPDTRFYLLFAIAFFKSADAFVASTDLVLFASWNVHLVPFQYFLKIPLYALMPHGFQKRLDYSKSHFLFGSHVIGVTISLITGAATHLLWDSFTHAGSPIVENSVALNFLLFEIMDYKVWLYKILQHGSTLLGITLLIYWTGCWYRKAKITQHNRKPLLENNIRWKVLMIILILPVLTGFWHGHALFSESITVKSIQILVGDTLRSGIALMVSGLFIYSLIFKCKKKL